MFILISSISASPGTLIKTIECAIDDIIGSAEIASIDSILNVE